MNTTPELPEHLAERTRVLKPLASDQKPSFVLYWMRTAVRVDENPALDVAKLLASQHDVPLLVYHAISEHYRYASDRHHTFMVEGAKDVQAAMAKAGVAYALHVATVDDRKPHLIELADQAGVVVTEDMPVDPPRRFLASLVQRTTAKVIAVDTACVVPMQLVGKAYTRAFQFRSATKKLFAARITRGWPAVDVEVKPFGLEGLSFQPINLDKESLPALVARCEIDHSVGPVVDTVGGSEAGYARWNEFRERGLKGYARRRNNPLLDGSSRMSAYLHYGMVSPFRIARETAEYDHEGAEKYLDELLIWRELAYSFCYHLDDHDQWSALPEWAQETLQAHRNDHREAVYSWEELARARTNDELWNAAQLSLLRQGELHNNVRMTWGKAIAAWTPSPQAALRMTIDLNHRYALDGRDSASYGGILWCFGQFDRPFEPEQSVIGTVRPRPSQVHAERLSPDEFRSHVATPRFEAIRVAIVGAGLSGMFAARTLMDHGVDVCVFDKSRGVGGRMSTRRTDTLGSFDHGAQYFTARDRRFRRYVEAWKQQGVVGRWPSENAESSGIVVLKDGEIASESKSQERFVGVPSMNAICKHLAEDATIRFQTRVEKIKRESNGNRLVDDQGNDMGLFDAVLVSAPAEQSVELLSEYPALAKPISDLEMKPCWACMVSFASPVSEDWLGAFIHDSFLSWVARNSTKPGRDSSVENLVIHATPDWTAAHWEEDADVAADLILKEFWRVSGSTIQEPLLMQAHRWKYALAAEPSRQGYFFDQESQVGACGDWANGSRVEGAFLSGMGIAGRVLAALKPLNASAQKQLF